MALPRRRIRLRLMPFTIAVVALLVWWPTIEPSNDRAWQPDVARLPSAEINGDLVTLRNIRSFEYRSASDYTEHWYDRTVDLRRLESLDLIAVYRVHARPENIRRLFIEYLAQISQMREQTEFYNTAITNCTTNIVPHVRALRGDVPLDWRTLLSSYFPELVYARGGSTGLCRSRRSAGRA
jgi:hypothetical protein